MTRHDITPLPAQQLHVVTVALPKIYDVGETFTVQVAFSGIASCGAAGGLNITWCWVAPDEVYFLDGSHTAILLDQSPASQRVDDLDSTLEVRLPAQFTVGGTGLASPAIDHGEDGTRSHVFAGKHLPVMAFSAHADYVQDVAIHGTLPLRAAVRSHHQSLIAPAVARVRDVLDFHADRYGPLVYESMSFTEIASRVGVGGIGFASGLFFDGLGLTNPDKDPNTVQLIAHELGHQWIGNMLPPANLSSFWLQEGNTEYAAYRYITEWSQAALGEDIGPKMRAQYMALYMFGLDPAKDEPLAPTDLASQDPVTFFLLNYVKGGTVVESLATTIGEDAYLEAMRALLDSHLLSTGMTLDDYQQAMQEASGQDLDQFCAEWVRRPGYPRYDLDYRATRSDSGGIDVTIQVVSEDDYHVPMVLAFEAPETAEQTRTTLQVHKGKTSTSLHLPFCPRRYAVDPDASFLIAHRSTLAGDCWRDGEVDGVDLVFATLSLGARGDDFVTKPMQRYRYTPHADFDLDGDVDDGDFSALQIAFGSSRSCRLEEGGPAGARE